MDGVSLIIGLVFGAIFAGGGVYLFILRAREAAAAGRVRLESQLEAAQNEARRLEGELARAREENGAALEETRRLEQAFADERARRETETRAANERLAELKELKERFETTFKALSAEALRQNNAQFLELAGQSFGKLQTSATGDLEKRQAAIRQLVEPLQKSLEKVSGRIQEIETAREGAYQSLREQIRGLLESQGQLQRETGNLVQALRAPQVRGRWGELQLARTVEFAGMVEHVDFSPQVSRALDDGTSQRPDLVVHLPGGKCLLVDAKAPLDAYLGALEEGDADRQTAALKRHARQIRDHIKKLSAKEYWKNFQPTPEMVVLFLPGEAFFSAALQQDPTLIEVGADDNVLLATPTTLIALLRAVRFGWRQERIAEEALTISKLGRELYERIAVLGDHFQRLASSLNTTVEHFNKAMNSLDSRVMVTARRFAELKITEARELPALDAIRTQAVPARSAELSPPES